MSYIALMLAVAIAIDLEPANPAARIAMVSGNGSLTAGFDVSGALMSLRWPGPGGPDQLRPADANRHELPLWFGGGRWGFEIDGRWYWQGDPKAIVRQAYAAAGSPIIETTIEWPDAGLVVRQRAGVNPDADLFGSSIEVSRAPSPPRIVWIGYLSPSTRQIPEIATGYGGLSVLHGFAAFEGPTGWGWSFRPNNPGSADWARAQQLADANADPRAWDEFSDGVWLGICARWISSQGEAPLDVGFAPSVSAVNDALELDLPVVKTLIGPSRVVVRSDAPRAWIAVSVGENRTQTKQIFGRGTRRWWDFLEDIPVDHPALTAKAAKFSEQSRPQTLAHLRTLNTLRDSNTGFTVRSVASDPPLARDWPRDGALVAWALFECGQVEAAGKSVDAYMSLIRTNDRPRKPYGSMPESVYTSGEIASPHFVIDDRGPARVLWVAERLLRTREPQASAAWVNGKWKAIEAAGEFLSTWSDARRGAPLYSGDPIGLADAETQDRLFAAHAGLSAAIRLAETAKKEVPDAWRNRRKELLDLCEWVLKEPNRWVPGGSLVLEKDGLSESAVVGLAQSCTARLTNPSDLSREALARLLLQQAILGPVDPANLETSLDLIDTVGVNSPNSPDALVSAEVLLAVLLSQGK